MKKHLFIYVLFITLLMQSIVFAENNTELDNKLACIGLCASTVQDDKKDIEQLFKNQSKYANSHNLKKIDALYADKYHNFDGLTRNDFFKMIQETWDLYTDLQYTTEVKNIVINGTYADVEVVETAKGKTKAKCETTKKLGNISNTSNIIYNLEKIGKKWQIVSDNVLKEQTYLLYGDANDVAMDLYAPSQISANTQYNVVFDVKVPKGYFALASITNQDIIYPQKPPKEVFRNIKPDTVLERVITSNNNNHNEYTIASIGLTKANMAQDNQIHISVVGLGFLMNRVNVIPMTKGNK